MSEQTEHTVNSPTESSQRPAPQEILGQAGRRGTPAARLWEV